MTANERMGINDVEGWDCQGMLFLSLIYFWRERYRVIITDGAFRTQIRGDIVCQGMVDTKSKFVRVSLKKYSVHNLGVTLCVNTTQG
jgi:hypothetical protein